MGYLYLFRMLFVLHEVELDNKAQFLELCTGVTEIMPGSYPVRNSDLEFFQAKLQCSCNIIAYIACL